VEHHVAPDADLKIESVPQPLLEKLRAGGTWEVLVGPRGPINSQALHLRWLAIEDQSIPNRAGEPTLVTVQVVKTGITPQLATSDRSREAETEPLPPAGRLHMRR